MASQINADGIIRVASASEISLTPEYLTPAHESALDRAAADVAEKYPVGFRQFLVIAFVKALERRERRVYKIDL